MNGVRGFLGTARWVAPQSLAAVALVGFAALFEGVALLALAPIFQQGIAGGPAGLAAHIADRLGVPAEQLALFSLGLFLSLAIISAAARFAGDALLLWIRTRVEEMARRRMTEALMQVRWEVFPELKLGEIGKSIYQEGWWIGVGTQVTLQASGLFVALLFYLAIALSISAALTALAIVVGAGAALLVRALNRRVRPHTEGFIRLNSEIGNRVQDIFAGLKFFRASGLAASAREAAMSLYRNFARSYFRAYGLGYANRFVVEALALLFVASVLYIGVAVHDVQIASLIIFFAILLRASPRLLFLQDLLFQAATYEVWHREWRERLEFALANKEGDSGAGRVEFRNSLRFSEVWFSYPKRSEPVVQGVTFSLEAGEFVGVVGASGSGKSTLLDLLTGVLQPTRGRIEVDGVDLRNLSLQSWRTRIGLVLQETPIFYGSVFDNVVWGIPERDEERALTCLKQAHALPILKKLSRGVHAEVGERGAQLSGGERQRIALARALYRAPALLILDEATSALDGRSEQEILHAIAELKGSCAILTVAHRLSAVRDADRILVLDGGRIVEEGSWQDLVARPGTLLRSMALSQGVLAADSPLVSAK